MRWAVLGIALCVVFGGVQRANAECVDLIRASATRQIVVEGEQEIERQARDFCREYASSRNSGRSAQGTLGFKGLEIGGGASRSNSDQIAERYCDASNRSDARANSYQSYVEAIAPGAYSAYQKCLVAEATGVKLNLDSGAIHSDSLIASVAFSTNDTQAEVTMRFVASSGVTCAWEGVSGSSIGDRDVLIRQNGSAAIRCTRENARRRGSVTLVATTRSDAAFVIPWVAFEDDLPFDRLERLALSNAQLAQSLEGALLAFRGDTCPPGWEFASDLAGRFLLAAGHGNELTPREVGETGGEETHALTIDELPPHSHSGFVGNGGASFEHHQYNGRMPSESWERQTGSTGGGQPHNNMPPFHVVTFCERT